MRGSLGFPEVGCCVHTRVCRRVCLLHSWEALQHNCFLQSMARWVIKLHAGAPSTEMILCALGDHSASFLEQNAASISHPKWFPDQKKEQPSLRPWQDQWLLGSKDGGWERGGVL